MHNTKFRCGDSAQRIFTHIIWDMKGIYLEVAEPTGEFQWFTKDEINTQAALPTAFRLFLPEDKLNFFDKK